MRWICVGLICFALAGCGVKETPKKVETSFFFQSANQVSLLAHKKKFEVILDGIDGQLIEMMGEPIEEAKLTTMHAFMRAFVPKEYRGVVLVSNRAAVGRVKSPTYEPDKRRLRFEFVPIGKVDPELIGRALGEGALMLQREVK